MVDRSQIPVFQQDPVVVFLLSLITCSLYLIYWNLKASEVLNAASGREVISPVVSVISGCCTPVHIYYYYLAGQALRDVGRLIGREKELADKAVLLMVVGAFFPLVSAMIVQGHINEIYQQQN